jgi:site-specific DNA-methyltransferase (adenine-specific)/site-specific DNA-methyltransferase (cytosine-N4-specific)
MEQKILIGDCFDLIKEVPDNSVDLVITSPPYADIINYGKNVSVKKVDDYCDWILPLFKEVYRVLKPSGSFILNINDKCVDGYRNTFIFDLISRNSSETKLKMYDYYLWHKKAGIPNGSDKRFRNMTEWIFHFCKDKNQIKFYMDRVLEEPKVENGNKMVKIRPDNVFRFSTAGAARDNTIKHPAPYHKELPSYFINLLTDEGDLILDPFSGIGTTSLAAKELNRKSICFELNERYAEFSVKRLDNILDDEYVVNQYTLDDVFVKSYPNRSSAGRENNLCEEDIMRCYRGNRKTVGGYKWKLEKK